MLSYDPWPASCKLVYCGYGRRSCPTVVVGPASASAWPLTKNGFGVGCTKVTFCLGLGREGLTCKAACASSVSEIWSICWEYCARCVPLEPTYAAETKKPA